MDESGNEVRLGGSPTPKSGNSNGKWILFGILVAVVIGWWIYSEKEKPSERSPQWTLADRLAALASRHHAVSTWAEELPHTPVYSVELHRALVRPDQAPIVFVGTVEDIYERKGRMFIKVSAFPLHQALSLSFELECPSQIVESLLKQDSRYSQYLVAASVESVTKARFQVTGNGSVISDEGDVDVELEVQGGDQFLAKGKCIEVLPFDGNTS